jgi:hypothetical protein
VGQAIARRAANVQIDQEWVLSRLALVVERCLQYEPVRDREGNPAVIETQRGQLAAAYTFQPGAATRALELLSKHLGMFTDRMEVTNNAGERLFSELTEEELMERLTAKRAAKARDVTPPENFSATGGTVPWITWIRSWMSRSATGATPTKSHVHLGGGGREWKERPSAGSRSPQR